MVIKTLQRFEEPCDLGVPCERLGIVPSGFTLRHRKGPIEKIAHVREDIRRGTRAVAKGKCRERFGGATQSLTAAIGDRGHCVAKKLACWIGGCRHGDQISLSRE